MALFDRLFRNRTKENEKVDSDITRVEVNEKVESDITHTDTDEDNKKLKLLAEPHSEFNTYDLKTIILSLKEDRNKLEALRLCHDRMLYGIDEVVESLQEDASKIEALRLCQDSLVDSEIWEIIENFQEDTKLEALKVCCDKLFGDKFGSDNGDSIYSIVVDFQKENNIIEALRAFHDKFASWCIEDLIVTRVKQDNEKIELLKVLHDGMRLKDVASIICNIEDDSTKMDLLMEYYESGDEDYIYSIVEDINDDIILKSLKKYDSQMSGFMRSRIISCLHEDDIKEKLLREYAAKDTLGWGGKGCVIARFHGVNKRLELLEKYDNQLDGTDVTDIITSLAVNIRTVELCKKYYKRIDTDTLFSTINCMDNTEQQIETINAIISDINPAYKSVDTLLKDYPQIRGKHNIKDLEEHFVDEFKGMLDGMYRRSTIYTNIRI